MLLRVHGKFRCGYVKAVYRLHRPRAADDLRKFVDDHIDVFGGGNKATCMAHARNTTESITYITEAIHVTLYPFAALLPQRSSQISLILGLLAASLVVIVVYYNSECLGSAWRRSCKRWGVQNFEFLQHWQ